MHRETVGRLLDQGGRELLDTLLAFPGIPAAAANCPDAGLPIIPLGFVRDGEVMRYFSMVTTVATPTTVAAQELRVECLFPADQAT